MKDYYDFSKGFKNPELAKRLKKNGCRVQITCGEGDEEIIVKEYFVPPEENSSQQQAAQ
ncbi:MAG: hypothetical protein FWE74_03740 [Oscillospiraceae bacterium]|nr:hypothetical protein [Oscillospiraceae bacterium]